MVLHIVVVTSHHEFLLFTFLFGNGFHEFFENLVEGVVALMFAHERFGDGVNLVVGFAVDALAELFVVGFVAVFAFRVGFFHLSGEVELSLALHLDGSVGCVEGLYHVGFGDFLHLTFHHHDVVDGGSHDHVNVRAFHVFHGGVDDHLAIHAAHAHFGDGAFPRNVGDGEGGRSCEACEGVGQVVAVAGDEGDEHLRLSVEVVGEERTEGAVHEAGDEDFILAGTAFAFEETAGEATHSAVFLLIFDLQRHEVGVFHCVFLAADGGEQHGVAHFYDGGSIGLLGEDAGFDGHFTAIGELEGLPSSEGFI